MIHAIVSVTSGEPDFDWNNPPIESYQLNDSQRYCKFTDGVEIRPDWTVITEEQFNQIKPTIVEPEPTPTLEDKINYLYYKSMGVIS